MLTKPAIQFAFAFFTMTPMFGCAWLHEENFSIPHGTPIQHDDIPRELRVKLALPESAVVERYGQAVSLKTISVSFCV
ncbi:MAG: hypothetical protein MI861_08630 [Pirellulales bacterium]|nr:hypothetical protein [Pirellulales bacterium]